MELEVAVAVEGKPLDGQRYGGVVEVDSLMQGILEGSGRMGMGVCSCCWVSQWMQGSADG